MPELKRLLIIGAGGYGRAVAEAAMAMGGHTVVGFVDDRWPALMPIWGLPVVGRLADLPGLRLMSEAVVPAIGNTLAHDLRLEVEPRGLRDSEAAGPALCDTGWPSSEHMVSDKEGPVVGW